MHALPAPDTGSKITYDSELSGFGVRVTAAGARSYVLNYRMAGRERRFTIGDAKAWKCSPARDEAARLKARVRLGDDPLAELQQARAEPTMGDLCDVFEAEYLPRLRAATVKQYRSAIDGSANRAGIRRHFRQKRVAEVSHHDVEEFHRIISRAAPTMANRALAVLSRMFGAAIRRGWRADNPAKGTERNQETKRTRYLSPPEIARLTEALAALGDQQAANIFRFLLLTGARRGEVQAMRWDQIDLDTGIWTKPGSTTKQKTEHRVPLSAPALQMLAGLERPGNYVFPGRDGEGHRVEVKAQWANVCEAAGISGVRHA